MNTMRMRLGFKWIGRKRKMTTIEGVTVNPVEVVAFNSVVGIRRMSWRLNRECIVDEMVAKGNSKDELCCYCRLLREGEEYWCDTLRYSPDL